MLMQKLANRKNKGQAMTEYVIIICLVAVAALLVVGVFGTNIRRLFATADQSLASGAAQQVTMDTNASQDTNSSVAINQFQDGSSGE